MEQDKKISVDTVLVDLNKAIETVQKDIEKLKKSLADKEELLGGLELLRSNL